VVKRGDLYLVKKPGSGDPKRQRVFVVVSHQSLLDTSYSTVICAPVYSNYHGLKTQVLVGRDEGLKTESAIHCDNLTSIPRNALTDHKGTLSIEKLQLLDEALAVALGLR
jgi:mRNA interferase MazF